MMIQGKEVTVWCPACNIEVHGHTGYATVDGSIHCDNCKTACVSKKWFDESKTLKYKMRKFLWTIFHR